LRRGVTLGAVVSSDRVQPATSGIEKSDAWIMFMVVSIVLQLLQFFRLWVVW